MPSLQSIVSAFIFTTELRVFFKTISFIMGITYEYRHSFTLFKQSKTFFFFNNFTFLRSLEELPSPSNIIFVIGSFICHSLCHVKILR